MENTCRAVYMDYRGARLVYHTKHRGNVFCQGKPGIRTPMDLVHVVSKPHFAIALLWHAEGHLPLRTHLGLNSSLPKSSCELLVASGSETRKSVAWFCSTERNSTSILHTPEGKHCTWKEKTKLGNWVQPKGRSKLQKKPGTKW